MSSNGRAQPATPTVAPGEEESVHWESVASDTADPSARADTAPNSAARKAAPVAPKFGVVGQLILQDQRRLWLLIGLMALVVVPLLMAALWLAFFRHPDVPRDEPKQPPVSTVLTVSPSGKQGSAFRTVREALRRARPGYRVVVLDERIEEEPLTVDGQSVARDVTLEPAESVPSVEWLLPAKVADARQLLLVTGIEGFRLRRFTLDGRGAVNELITLSGTCPGVVVQDVRLRGFRTNGIDVINCEGQKDRPVVIQGVRFVTTRDGQAALAFELNPSITNPRVNQYIRVCDDCLFEGPSKTFIRRANPSVTYSVELPDLSARR